MKEGSNDGEGASDLPEDNTLLILDDDKPFLSRLARAMEARGFQVMTAESVREGLEVIERAPPAFAIVDMRLMDAMEEVQLPEVKAEQRQQLIQETSPEL